MPSKVWDGIYMFECDWIGHKMTPDPFTHIMSCMNPDLWVSVHRPCAGFVLVRPVYYFIFSSVSWSRSCKLSAYEVSAESVLSNHGGLKNTDFVKCVNDDPINDGCDEIDTRSKSPYFLHSNLPNIFINYKSSNGILSLNSGSLSAKFNSLQIWLESSSLQKYISQWYSFRSRGSQTIRCSNYFN